MRRTSEWLDILLNTVLLVMTAALVVLAVLSLIGGPTLRFAPYMAGACALYYLALAVKVFAEGGRHSFLKGSLLALLTLFLCGFAYLAYRCL